MHGERVGRLRGACQRSDFRLPNLFGGNHDGPAPARFADYRIIKGDQVAVLAPLLDTPLGLVKVLCGLTDREFPTVFDLRFHQRGLFSFANAASSSCRVASAAISSACGTPKVSRANFGGIICIFARVGTNFLRIAPLIASTEVSSSSRSHSALPGSGVQVQPLSVSLRAGFSRSSTTLKRAIM